MSGVVYPELTVLMTLVTAVSSTTGVPIAAEGGLAATAVEPIQASQALAVTGPQPDETVHPVAKTATM